MLKLLAFKQLCPLLKPQPESRTLQKNLIKAIITKKNFRILFFHKIQKMMKKKIFKIQKHRIKKKASKKSTKFDHEKKSTKTLQKPKS